MRLKKFVICPESLGARCSNTDISSVAYWDLVIDAWVKNFWIKRTKFVLGNLAGAASQNGLGKQ